MKIGLFDSGLGGLVILKAVANELPEYDYEFYGDTDNLPYGEKTEEEIYSLTKKGVEYLFNKNCSIVIIACNTASAETLRKLQDGFIKNEHTEKKVLGVIIPTVETVIDKTYGKVLLLGTSRTVNSGKYDIELGKRTKLTRLSSVATPELVPLIEQGKLDEALKIALGVISNEDGEGVILGCTHYSLLKNGLRQVLDKTNKYIFSQDEIIPTKLKMYLDNHLEIKEKLSKGSTRTIFLTNNGKQHDYAIQKMLGGSFIGE